MKRSEKPATGMGMYACQVVTTCLTLNDPPDDSFCTTDCTGPNNLANYVTAPVDATAIKSCVEINDGMSDSDLPYRDGLQGHQHRNRRAEYLRVVEGVCPSSSPG